MVPYIILALLLLAIVFGVIQECREEREKARRTENFRKALANLDKNFPTDSIYDKL